MRENRHVIVLPKHRANVDWVGEFFAEVNDGGIEHDHFGADGGEAGEDSAEDAGGHGTALVNADDDYAE
jgi:hypothetical protein